MPDTGTTPPNHGPASTPSPGCDSAAFILRYLIP